MTQDPLDHIDDIAKQLWSVWKEVRLSQGWSLGANTPDHLMSPYLVHSYEGLDDRGKQYFTQQVAMVLASLESSGFGPSSSSTEPALEGPLSGQDPAQDQNSQYTAQKVAGKLNSALQAFANDDVGRARRKTRTAYKLLVGEPIRPRKK